MDAAEIAQMVKDLQISKDMGGKGITITKEEERRGQERLAKTVVGRIFARRQVNKEILKTHMPRILRARGGMELEIIGHNLIAISFALASDKRVALEEGPWHFFQDLMIFKETEPMQSIADVEFNEITMWIQCHNVPMACMDVEILERIGGQVGLVEEIDMDEGGIRLGKMIRMRITRRLDIPLVRCVPVNSESNEDVTMVIIQYEKLPHFCYACGRIGHILKDCEDEQANNKELRYDQRLRVGLSSLTQTHRSREGATPSRGVLGRGKVGDGSRECGEPSSKGDTVGEEGVPKGKELVVVTENGGEKGSEGVSDAVLEARGEGGMVDVLDVEVGSDRLGKQAMEAEEYIGQGLGDERGGTGSPTRGGLLVGRRKWKRSARERSLCLEGEGSDGKSLGHFHSGSKRGELALEGEDQPPQKRRDSSGSGVGVISLPTAEAAMQPRRQQ